MTPEEVRAEVLKALEDVKQSPPATMRDELAAAGWQQTRSRHIWRSPDGGLYIGPYSAWKRMKAQETTKR